LLPKRARKRAELELGDIQGNLLRGYSHPHVFYCFLKIADAVKGKQLLAALLTEVTSAKPWAETSPQSTLNVSLTFEGLAALGVDDRRLASFPEDFRQGMAKRAELLGDIGTCDPKNWDIGLGTGDAHILVSVGAADTDVLSGCLNRLQQKVEAAGGVEVINQQLSQTLPGSRDHFGFVDGIAQPAVGGSGVAPRPGDGAVDRRNRWRELAAGEFVLGYEDEDGLLPAAPAAPFDRNATFAVYRKIYMNVALFRQYTQSVATVHAVDPEWVAAKFVGRWRDGTPLVISPEKPDPAVAADPGRINDFSFSDDGRGWKCPAGAHIRRVNPRDHEGFFGGILSNRHRIIRRGRPYGNPLADSVSEDDGLDRGLIFKCYNTSIERQFEVIQRLWIDDGDPLGCGADKDPLVGNPCTGPGKMVIPGHNPIVLHGHPVFTAIRGGEYLFRPSLSALRWLADAHSGESGSFVK
jgi:Dyp-type peroxidase family